jgi:hypothetical protein
VAQASFYCPDSTPGVDVINGQLAPEKVGTMLEIEASLLELIECHKMLRKSYNHAGD